MKKKKYNSYSQKKIVYHQSAMFGSFGPHTSFPQQLLINPHPSTTADTPPPPSTTVDNGLLIVIVSSLFVNSVVMIHIFLILIIYDNINMLTYLSYFNFL